MNMKNLFCLLFPFFLFSSCGEDKNSSSSNQDSSRLEANEHHKKIETANAVNLQLLNNDWTKKIKHIEKSSYLLTVDSKDFKPKVKIVWSSLDKDLDGDNIPESLIIFPKSKDYFDNEYEAGNYQLTLSINGNFHTINIPWPAKSYWGAETKFKIIDINKNDGMNELLISFFEEEDEDPSTQNIIVRLFKNQITTFSLIRSYGYSNGRLHFTDMNSFHCEHGRYPTIRGEYALSDYFIRRINYYEQPEDEVDWENVAACPFVYLNQNIENKFQGEILRHLDKQNKEGWQRLKVFPENIENGKIKITLSEEKDEETYLNALYLEVNDKKILPTITDNQINKIIRDDDKYLTIKKGDFLEFTFPYESSDLSNVYLHAKGFYIPTKDHLEFN